MRIKLSQLPLAFDGGDLRRALKQLASAGTVSIAGLVLAGWALGNRRLVTIIPGAVPMPPMAAILFALSAVALHLCDSRASRHMRRIFLVCVVAVTLSSLTRLGIYEAGAAGAGSAFDQLLFRETLARISAELAPPRISTEFAPIHIQMAPDAAINFLLIDATLFIAHCRRRRFRLAAFAATLASMMIAGLTIGSYFINVATPDSLIGAVPMALSSAVAFLLLAAGVLTDLAAPSWKTSRDDRGRTSAAGESPGASLDHSVAVAFAAAIFMLVGIGISSHKSIDQILATSRWESHTYQVIAAIHALRADLKDSESDTRAYIITGERRYLATYETAAEAIDPRVQTLKALTADNPVQQRRIEVLHPLIEQKLAVMRDKQSRRKPGFVLELLTPLVTEGERLMEEVDRGLREMEAQENQLLKTRMMVTRKNASRATWMITTGAVLALFLVTAAGWMVSRDSAKRTRTEVALRASDTMFRGLLESAPDAMVIVNERGGIEFFNAQAEVMFGYTARELSGQPIEMIIPQRYRAEHIVKRDAYFSEPVVRGMGLGRELYGIRKDGTEFPVEISLSPLRTPMGLRVSSAIRDVTRQKHEAGELKNLNTMLQARTSQLEIANRELESFSYSVSHDLRAPLRSIDGFSQALLEDNMDKLDAQSQNYLKRVRAASQKMGHLIDDLLTLSRMSRVEMRRETVDLSGIALEVVDELRGAGKEREVDVVIADGLSGEGDPSLLRVVLANLLGNAWKFTGNRSRARIEFGYCAQGGNEGYFVRDNGAGFDMTYAEKLFGAFQRLHTTAEFPGTGIGLATVQRIIHRHGGRVWAEAAVDAGATFHFALSAKAA